MLERAAREQAEHSENAGSEVCVGNVATDGVHIHKRNIEICADTVDEDDDQGEKHFFAEIRDLPRVFDRLKAEGIKSKLILQIHDELLIEAPIEEAERAREILEEEMKAAASLDVVLETDCHIGTDWYEAK